MAPAGVGRLARLEGGEDAVGGDAIGHHAGHDDRWRLRHHDLALDHRICRQQLRVVHPRTSSAKIIHYVNQIREEGVVISW